MSHVDFVLVKLDVKEMLKGKQQGKKGKEKGRDNEIGRKE
jgi:hypothetical protein